ncbi:Sialic acid-binding periplasmic protein SiaP precursor [Marinomonas gallaica]|uniref:Sialic acid-binding periplasmic protein SiaP n=1 Tax=Marinomonas gallaica TaxID=1806667 RepID=A0A1C3JN96_9GAMM|nr:TRAP transporter substrate-binding protein [Marinomonas gallaica]SBT16646.1 Sialic acid-binding periplasmic protein SiaP precursor [Marinomonas gallaica]SBT20362.1 Sialic acid-binding periplasmic protein SiaP precursor [Marinomonas gallaica]
MKYLGRKGLALIAGTVLSVNAIAEAEFTLKLHHMLPPMAMAHAQFLEPWAEKVEAESNGRIDIEIYPAMQLGGKPPQLFDQVRKGISDITWTVTGYTPGRFPKSTVFELPFIPGTAKATSLALQEYAQTEMQDEMKDVHLLAMHTHAPGSLHSRDKAIKTLEDIESMKVRAPNKIMNNAFRSLGANTTFMPVTEMASAISKGVLDVAVLPYEVVLPMKIHELVDYHTEFKGDRGLYTNTFIFAMNKDVYEDLPADLQKVIDDNSGLALAGHLGTLWDNYEVAARDYAVKEGNHFDYIEGAEYERWKEKLAPITDEWVEDMNDDDYDGQRLLDKAHDLVKKYEAM